MSTDCRTDLVVTDVDNTIFDWVGIWAGAFDALIQSLSLQTRRSADEWLAAARAVHAWRGATECATLLEDLAAHDWPDGPEPSAVLPRAAAVYRRYWDVHLAPFQGVREVLTALAQHGIAVVAYTESDAAVTAARLTRMGLAGVIRIVFGRTAHPHGKHPEWSLAPPASRSPINIDLVPQQDSKPNPLGLRQILGQCAVAAQHAAYVGDSLRTDVVMAQRLGVRAFWAWYGTNRRPEHVDLLDRVAHWAGSDVAEERAGTVDTTRPDAVLLQPMDLLAHVAQAAAVMA
jgi:phosphoglycolate phosphatase